MSEYNLRARVSKLVQQLVRRIRRVRRRDHQARSHCAIQRQRPRQAVRREQQHDVAPLQRDARERVPQTVAGGEREAPHVGAREGVPRGAVDEGGRGGREAVVRRGREREGERGAGGHVGGIGERGAVDYLAHGCCVFWVVFREGGVR